MGGDIPYRGVQGMQMGLIEVAPKPKTLNPRPDGGVNRGRLHADRERVRQR